MKKLLLILMILFVFAASVRADEGMWLPNLIGKMKIKDMRSKGFKLTAQDLYDINQASLKDAIVRFGRGCTGEIISEEGLLITNHHCGYSQIQSHSSVENDYLTNGFWAMNKGEELPNPDLTISILKYMDDVTEQSLKGVTEQMTEAERQALIAKNNAKIVEKAVEENGYTASVEPFYYGNQYFLFVYEVFRDIRLVGAPPSAIGKFGGDTDNWMWPRHTGDFSVFRIYANKDNRPAAYSKDNVPYKPKKSLTISLKGAKEGDFTFVYGFPGKTTEYVTSDAIEYLATKGNPHKINLRTIRLNIMGEEQNKDVATRIKYASKHASAANAWKKWQGERKGVVRLKVVDAKREQEKQFAAWAADKPEYSSVLPRLKELYAELDDYAFARDYYMETFSTIELTGFASEFAKINAENLTDQKLEGFKKDADAFYKNYSAVIDQRIATAMLEEYAKNVPAKFQPAILETYKKEYGNIKAGVDRMFAQSSFSTPEKFNALFFIMPKSRLETALKSDPAIQLYNAFSAMYKAEIQKQYLSLTTEIETLYRTYMRGLMAMQQERAFYPDANSTLRIAYGKVAGYKAADAVRYGSHSSLEGIMEKDNPEIYDYDVPQKLRELYKNKDYGRWAVDGTIPVAFIATNHTTGGNSGSPILNAKGELLGLNFDRTWESTMSDVQYDPAVCRNISVDIRYVLFVIDKVAGAGYLLEEMKFAK